MSKLVRFELKKIFSKVGIKLIILLLIIVCFIVSLLNHNKRYEDEMIFYEDVKVVTVVKEKNDNYKRVKKEIKNNNLLYDYSLKNKNSFYNKSKNMINFSFTILMFLTIALIIISSNSITSEYSDNTIKLLFTLPYTRKQIYKSKLISLLFITILLSMLLSLLMITFTIFFEGYKDILTNDIILLNGKVIEIPFLINFYRVYFLLLIPVTFIMLITFFLSTIFLNNSLSVGLSLFLSILGMSIFNFFVKIKIYFLKYTFLPYLDFTIFLNKVNIAVYNYENYIQLSIYKGIIILIIYSFIFYKLSFSKFKKDVRN